MKAVQHSFCYRWQEEKDAMICRDLACEPESGFSHIVENHVIGLYPSCTFQTVEGFGCAMTETSCSLLAGLPAEQRREALSLWFGPEEGKARFIRIPIDSCDYALSEYQAVPDPISDPELKTFSISRDQKYMIPVVKEALALCGGKLSVLMSPWSPPWQWKTPPLDRENDAAVYGGQKAVREGKPSRCNGGSLKPEYYASWAAYLIKYLQAYLAEGIPVTMLSVQNEAAAATPWDSCVWTGEEERIFVKDFLFPALKAAGLAEQVGLFIWDHNKERMVENIEEIMDEETAPMIAGFAYHWYTGDHFEALSLVKGKYPDKILMHSESCPLHKPGKAGSADMDLEALRKKPRAALSADELAVLEGDAGKTPAEMDAEDALAYAHDMIGDLNHGMERWIDWNMIVDMEGGPRHVPGGFAAPLLLDGKDGVIRTRAYECLRLIMDTIPAGSVRIGSSSYAQKEEAVAVRLPDGEIRVLILHPTAKEETVFLRLDGRVITVSLPADSLTAVSVRRS